MQRKLIEHDIPLAEIPEASSREKSIRTHEDGTLAEIRYIEVKARARSGAVRISSTVRRAVSRISCGISNAQFVLIPHCLSCAKC